MEKLAKVILEVTTWSWIVFVIIAIVMTLNSCQNKSMASEVEGIYANQCENCDEID